MKSRVKIDTRWDNISDVFPTEMRDFESYLNSKKGISDAHADICGLINPDEEFCLLLSYILTHNKADGAIDAYLLNGNLLRAELVKRDGSLFKLSESDLLEIRHACENSVEPFVHTMLDQMTLKFIKELIS